VIVLTLEQQSHEGRTMYVPSSSSCIISLSRQPTLIYSTSTDLDLKETPWKCNGFYTIEFIQFRVKISQTLDMTARLACCLLLGHQSTLQQLLNHSPTLTSHSLHCQRLKHITDVIIIAVKQTPGKRVQCRGLSLSPT